jgi:predicted O-methyltransferase YrrM
MKKIKLIFDLSYLPEGFTGHLIPSTEVVEALIKISQKKKMKKILEIGFNTGWSAEIFFKIFKDISITSIEINKHSDSIKALEIINAINKNSLFMLWEDSSKVYEMLKKKQNLLPESSYDTAFIDGDHSYEGVKNDINLCMHLGIKNFIFDDALSPEVLRAIREEKKLKLIKNYPYPPLRKINGKYFIKKVKYQTGLGHYMIDFN